eukprot:TRINITY_DN2750_c0_g1_i4.p1 TRINITY_DN2750_c0_g1~~TRINITY_DN2750_c0_g1_i4.p1  ORF type:complete len:182 (+),score=21.00 TRINITY_DN2750_c0_g1_i4:30-575(+)
MASSPPPAPPAGSSSPRADAQDGDKAKYQFNWSSPGKSGGDGTGRGRSPSPGGRRRSLSRSPGPRRGRSPSPTQDNHSTVHMSGLSYRTTESQIEQLLSKYGRIRKCTLVMDPRSRVSREFAFVEFEDSKDAKDAIMGMDRTDLDGRTISVQMCTRKPKTTSICKNSSTITYHNNTKYKER